MGRDATGGRWRDIERDVGFEGGTGAERRGQRDGGQREGEVKNRDKQRDIGEERREKAVYNPWIFICK